MRWGPSGANWGRLTPRMARLVRERDKVCVDCGSHGELVHHIVYRMGELNRGEFADPHDVVLLCHSCHGQRHQLNDQGQPTRAKGRLAHFRITDVREAELDFWLLIDLDASLNS